MSVLSWLVKVAPFGLQRFAMHLQRILSAFAAAKMKYLAVILDKHSSSAQRDIFPAECALSHQRLPLFLCVKLLASISVSRSMIMSFSRIGRLTFLLSTLFLSGPSKTFARTCTIPPLVPVLPTTSSTTAGTAEENNDPALGLSCGCCCAGFCC